jgi:TM2 domain-containing membrane protein YozV
MALSTNQLILIEQRVTNEAKSTAAAYLLWFFLGWISAHRFYLGKPVTAILQILSYLVVIGFLWWLIDAFLIPGIIQADKDNKRLRMMAEMSRMPPDNAPSALPAS